MYFVQFADSYARFTVSKQFKSASPYGSVSSVIINPFIVLLTSSFKHSTMVLISNTA